MSQDELILTLLRAIARSLTCDECQGQGIVYRYQQTQNGLMPIFPGRVCSCRDAIRELLKPQGV